jgi:hypothetical protein
MRTYEKYLTEAKYNIGKPTDKFEKRTLENFVWALEVDGGMKDKAKSLEKKFFFNYKPNEKRKIADAIEDFISRHVLDSDEEEDLWDIKSDFE